MRLLIYQTCCWTVAAIQSDRRSRDNNLNIIKSARGNSLTLSDPLNNKKDVDDVFGTLETFSVEDASKIRALREKVCSRAEDTYSGESDGMMDSIFKAVGFQHFSSDAHSYLDYLSEINGKSRFGDFASGQIPSFWDSLVHMWPFFVPFLCGLGLIVLSWIYCSSGSGVGRVRRSAWGAGKRSAVLGFLLTSVLFLMILMVSCMFFALSVRRSSLRAACDAYTAADGFVNGTDGDLPFAGFGPKFQNAIQSLDKNLRMDGMQQAHAMIKDSENLRLQVDDTLAMFGNLHASVIVASQAAQTILSHEEIDGADAMFSPLSYLKSPAFKQIMQKGFAMSEPAEFAKVLSSFETTGQVLPHFRKNVETRIGSIKPYAEYLKRSYIKNMMDPSVTELVLSDAEYFWIGYLALFLLIISLCIVIVRITLKKEEEGRLSQVPRLLSWVQLPFTASAMFCALYGGMVLVASISSHEACGFANDNFNHNGLHKMPALLGQGTDGHHFRETLQHCGVPQAKGDFYTVMGTSDDLLFRDVGAQVKMFVATHGAEHQAHHLPFTKSLGKKFLALDVKRDFVVFNMPDRVEQLKKLKFQCGTRTCKYDGYLLYVQSEFDGLKSQLKRVEQIFEQESRGVRNRFLNHVTTQFTSHGDTFDANLSCKFVRPLVDNAQKQVCDVLTPNLFGVAMVLFLMSCFSGLVTLQCMILRHHKKALARPKPLPMEEENPLMLKAECKIGADSPVSQTASVLGSADSRASQTMSVSDSPIWQATHEVDPGSGSPVRPATHEVDPDATYSNEDESRMWWHSLTRAGSSRRSSEHSLMEFLKVSLRDSSTRYIPPLEESPRPLFGETLQLRPVKRPSLIIEDVPEDTCLDELERHNSANFEFVLGSDDEEDMVPKPRVGMSKEEILQEQRDYYNLRRQNKRLYTRVGAIQVVNEYRESQAVTASAETSERKTGLSGDLQEFENEKLIAAARDGVVVKEDLAAGIAQTAASAIKDTAWKTATLFNNAMKKDGDDPELGSDAMNVARTTANAAKNTAWGAMNLLNTAYDTVRSSMPGTPERTPRGSLAESNCSATATDQKAAMSAAVEEEMLNRRVTRAESMEEKAQLQAKAKLAELHANEVIQKAISHLPLFQQNVAIRKMRVEAKRTAVKQFKAEVTRENVKQGAKMNKFMEKLDNIGQDL